jgi:hypothetical protein
VDPAPIEHETTPEERDESTAERLDRNEVELLNELRVTATGIQVLFAFLLVVPFNNRFPKTTGFERAIYIVTLCCIGISTILLIAPSIHHRILFRHGQKLFLVETGTRLLIVSSIFLAGGLTGILLLVCSFVLSVAWGIVVAVGAALITAAVWFVVPIRRRRHLHRQSVERQTSA